MDEEM